MRYLEEKRGGGFTLVEVTVAMIVMVVGLVSLAGLIVSISHHREAAAAKRLMLGRAARILEEIKGTTPDVIWTAYDKKKFRYGSNVSSSGGSSYDAETGAYTIDQGFYDGSLSSGNPSELATIIVSVDRTNPKLLVVTLNGTWTVSGLAHTLVLQTEIYHPSG